MAVPSLFDANWYLTNNTDVSREYGDDPVAAYAHFMAHGRFEGRDPGPLFNTQQYLFENPDVADAVRDTELTAYDHFVNHGATEDRSPLTLFDPQFYLQQNDDVKAAVDAGGMTAVEHFLNHGQNEGRQISVAVNLATYLEANQDVNEAVEAGHTTALAHLLVNGIGEGRSLGNGINLADFEGDAAFEAALESGEAGAALARVEAVAPFLPNFEAPEGWQPAPDTPIPTDFTPPEGTKLVIPDNVEVPPGTDLEDFEPQFEPVTATNQDLTGVATVGDTDMLYAGSGNPANDFFIATNEDVGIQLGLDVRYQGDLGEVDPVAENRFEIDPAQIAAARFAYTVASFDTETGEAVAINLEDFTYKLSIDTDATDETDFVTFTLVQQETDADGNDATNPSPYEWVREDGAEAVISDDGGAAHVTQNIQALQWYQDEGALPTEGDVYTVQLEAYGKYSGDLAASSSIIMEIGTSEPPADPAGLV